MTCKKLLDYYSKSYIYPDHNVLMQKRRQTASGPVELSQLPNQITCSINREPSARGHLKNVVRL